MSTYLLAQARSPKGRGFSLIELMVALAIGGILLGGAVTLFVNNRSNYQVSTDLSRLQENARFALDMIAKDIRMAGYFGCQTNPTGTVAGTVASNIGGPAGALWDPTYAIEGMDGSGAPGWLPSNGSATVGVNGSAGEVLAGTDAITLRYLAGDLSDVGDATGTATADNIPDWRVTAATSTQLSVNYFNSTTTTGQALGAAGVAGVADCGAAELFVIDPTSPAITPAAALSRTFTTNNNPTVAPFRAVRYYIGVAPGTAANPAGEPALYRSIVGTGPLAELPQMLFKGVENMQILYGVDTQDASTPPKPNPDGTPDAYLSAGAVFAATNADLTNSAANTWNRVVTVRIALLMRTSQRKQAGENLAKLGVLNGTNRDVLLAGQTVSFPDNDRRRRRIFESTAQARNL